MFRTPGCAGSDGGSHQRRLSSASSLPAMTASRHTSDSGSHSRRVSDIGSRSTSDGSSAQPGLEVRDRQGSDSAEKRGSEAGSEGSRDQAKPRLTPRTRSATVGGGTGGQCIAGGQRFSKTMWCAHLVLQQEQACKGDRGPDPCCAGSAAAAMRSCCGAYGVGLSRVWRGWHLLLTCLCFARSLAKSSWMKSGTTCSRALGPSLAPYLSGAGCPAWHC